MNFRHAICGFTCAFLGATSGHAQDEPVYYLNGDAVVTGDDCYQLTPALGFNTGSVWYADQVDLNQPLDLQFLINLGSADANGADGICFVMQTVGVDVIGESGGGLGFLGDAFQPAFAVEFDTWQNGQYGDPVADHIAMVSNGSVDHTAGTAIAGPVQADAFNANIEDGEDHQGRFTWDPDAQIARIYFDCELRLEATIDLVDDIFEGQNQVYFGFTASTGGSANVQSVCLEDNILGSAEQSFVCPGAELQLNVPSADGTADWSPGAFLDDSTTASPIVTPPNGLGDPLIYIAQYADQCGVDVLDTIQLNVEVMTAEVLGVTNLTCLTTQLQLSAASNFPGPFDAVWTAEDGSISPNGSLAIVEEPGTYSVLLSYQDGLCEAAATFTVGIDTATVPLDLPEEGFITCDEATFALPAPEFLPADLFFDWSTSDGALQGGGASAVALETGTYLATATSTITGCVSEATLEVLAADAVPVIAAGSVEPLTCLTPGQPVVGAGVADYAPFGGTGLTPSVSWTNTFDGTTNGVSPATGSFGPIINVAGVYQLVVEWEETGCSDSVLVSVTEGEDFGVDISSIAFPNVLTADNNGRNDSWYPFLEDDPDFEALSALTSYALRVYNRWGQLVYTNAGSGFSSGTPIRWYGTGGNGEPLASGAYWYIVDFTSVCGGPEGGSDSGTASGTLELIRPGN